MTFGLYTGCESESSSLDRVGVIGGNRFTEDSSEGKSEKKYSETELELWRRPLGEATYMGRDEIVDPLDMEEKSRG
jgi:hypothetical protein